MKELNKSRCLHGVKRHGVKLLGRNADQLTSAINIVVSRASDSAIQRIEALGGTVTTRFYSPTSIKRVLRGDSHPTISLDADGDFIARVATPAVLPSTIVQRVKDAFAGGVDSPADVKNEALRSVMQYVGFKYKYRLPDATGRKDIEYYRDAAHRGYLAYKVKEGESPSLYFKPPKEEGKEGKKQAAKREAAAKASADSRLF